MSGELAGRLARRPQYSLHPLRAARRSTYRFAAGRAGGAHQLLQLPWGPELEVLKGDAIGFSISVGRVFDPCVTETIYRLIDPGDTVVDVGANIGYVSSLAAARAGAGGRVLAFEPHPQVHELLQRNVSRWAGGELAPVTISRQALSSRPGSGELMFEPGFRQNMGLASLRTDGTPGPADPITVTVELATLDQVIGDGSVALAKIDVEGHEAEVLAGAAELLAAGRIRDIVFEDHDPYPSAATEPLERAGYQLLAIDNDLAGVTLLPPAERGEPSAWPGPSYLATRDPDRVADRMRRRLWRTPGILPWAVARAARPFSR